ncbi:alpha amylase C-terminal domain-containing protein [Carboxylicivirga caseinilyticus]|uniref:alpha amylase C-terminal domain-containing protein n=1 Tax=Carboxylicivirga caseinilyticus TaxID=3417572 RepID=UPI003D356FA9|nr:alpha amylase C-terminal domain-containing protein [Marinilabiliaceae bacterium A049]
MTTPNLIKTDPWLEPHTSEIIRRHEKFLHKLDEINEMYGGLKHFASRYEWMGLHSENGEWVLREWAPNATAIYLIGEFTGWNPKPGFQFIRKDKGIWELFIPDHILSHKDHFKLHVFWEGGDGHRIPSYAKRVIQDEATKGFDAQVWCPEHEYTWSDSKFKIQSDDFHPLIYEAHVGMSSEEEKVASFTEFTENVLPHIKSLGYNTIQLMAIQEHPYYGSFGYHVSNFFAVSSRFGTPEELKGLINTAHNMGIAVIMDIVHSHSVKNELEGLSNFDGDRTQYFDQYDHPAWDSRCFDYGKEEVLAFLLSNCRYWIEEFHFDGFRFDGVTSMIYHDHGLGKDFTGYDDYFHGVSSEDALCYLTLANQLIHDVKPYAISIAEEMSGYPGLAGRIKDGGIGFDYRLSMGVPDFWIKLIKEQADENWNVGQIYHELSQHRVEEHTISYAESHDQALVGDKTIIFRLADKEMYEHMSTHWRNLVIDRAMALHKMIRLITLGTASGGYLNFMGNEFGHPEWIDFPREGNGFSFKYARRQWSLVKNSDLRFKQLNEFDEAAINLFASEKVLDKYLEHRFDNGPDQVLAFSRGDYLFVFNFNPVQSFTGYGIPVNAGKYKVLFTTDDEKFGGFNRIEKGQMYYSQAIANGQHHLLLYLPARMALVIKKQEIKSVY